MIGGFAHLVLADFEFQTSAGNRPLPVCVTARDLKTGQTTRVWQAELLGLNAPPYPIGDDALFVSYYAPAELGCHLALDWQLPIHVLDLFAEFRCATNGLQLQLGAGLLGALAYFGVAGIDAVEKHDMRELILRGGPWTATERESILNYNLQDVVALEALLPRMLPTLSLPHALLRGRYMKAVARMEHDGIPIDVGTFDQLRQSWQAITQALVKEADAAYGIYDGTTFKAHAFESWLARNGIPWPRTATGRIDLSDATFRDMARAHPKVGPLRELRGTLAQLRKLSLAVGDDGRNRTMLSPLRSTTGRNQPSTAKAIFGLPVWLRSLIKPGPARAVAYIDWSQQEFAIAAGLSRDTAMMEAYSSGDPYLEFARQAGLVPLAATKESHPHERELSKQVVLAVQYGMGPQSLAARLGVIEEEAARLLRLHRRTYPAYWRWSDAALNHALLHQWLRTVFGWTIHVGHQVNHRSLRNFPIQANGAEMLRLACIFTTECGIRVCAPVHDAILVEAAEDRVDDVVATAQDFMRKASSVVLGGFELRSSAKTFRYPCRYQDPRGEAMWKMVSSILRRISGSSPNDLGCA